VTDEYPGLLLPPNALPSIDVKVASSRLKPSRASILFPKSVEEDLDHILKQTGSFSAKTPERSLFSGHAPAKVDARRAALDKYLAEILDTQMDITSALEICHYLSTNTMEPYADDVTPGGGESGSESPVKSGPGGRPLKNGYLTKRGKNFGGWKARYFVLDGPIFKYYESPGGPHLGAIKLQSAQIGKQQQQSDNGSPSRGEDDPDNQYRHAFLILEPKRKDSSSLVRHVLCAESDQERDQWVEALLKYVDYKDGEENDHHTHDRNKSSGSSNVNGLSSKKKLHASGKGHATELSDEGLRGISYENTKPGEAPYSRTKDNGTPSPPVNGYERDPLERIPQGQAVKNISAPKNAQPIQDASSWGNRQQLRAPEADEKIKQKKRSFFGFGTRPRVSSDADNNESTNLSQMAVEQHGPIRQVFGSPLGEAVRYNHPVDVDIPLPAVVYRCVEYLDSKNAAGEEGIFRLSGSNVVIKQLKERFNTEGDVNLITDDQYYDIHAVASLLKLYLRELPTTILTRELHLEFLGVTELHDVNEKISALNGLVHRLPRANNTLLRYLSAFLINIINHSDTNKMTVRNVGIVFSPTLNIPAPVFALFLNQYEGIFGEEPAEHNGPVEVTISAPPLTPEDIRSPRRQMFQELPTPSYDQQSFSQVLSFPQPQQHQQRAAYDTGFTPLQQPGYNPQPLYPPTQQAPSYEPQILPPREFPTMAGPEYGRAAQTLAGPAYDQFAGQSGYGNSNQAPAAYDAPQTANKKRRESSMFGMNIGLGQRKPSNQKLRDNRGKFQIEC
jgi:RalA-binding protein 1